MVGAEVEDEVEVEVEDEEAVFTRGPITGGGVVVVTRASIT